MAWMRPLKAAWRRAVFPVQSKSCGSAPPSNSVLRMLGWSHAAAAMRGVSPRLFLSFTSGTVIFKDPSALVIEGRVEAKELNVEDEEDEEEDEDEEDEDEDEDDFW